MNRGRDGEVLGLVAHSQSDRPGNIDGIAGIGGNHLVVTGTLGGEHLKVHTAIKVDARDGNRVCFRIVLCFGITDVALVQDVLVKLDGSAALEQEALKQNGIKFQFEKERCAGISPGLLLSIVLVGGEQRDIHTVYNGVPGVVSGHGLGILGLAGLALIGHGALIGFAVDLGQLAGEVPGAVDLAGALAVGAGYVYLHGADAFAIRAQLVFVHHLAVFIAVGAGDLYNDVTGKASSGAGDLFPSVVHHRAGTITGGAVVPVFCHFGAAAVRFLLPYSVMSKLSSIRTPMPLY